MNVPIPPSESVVGNAVICRKCGDSELLVCAEAWWVLKIQDLGLTRAKSAWYFCPDCFEHLFNESQTPFPKMDQKEKSQ